MSGAFGHPVPAERPRTPDVDYGVPAEGGSSPAALMPTSATPWRLHSMPSTRATRPQRPTGRTAASTASSRPWCLPGATCRPRHAGGSRAAA